MFAKSIMFLVGSSALILGCAVESSEPAEQESVSKLTGVYTQSILQTGTALVHDEDSFGDFKMADMDLDGRPDLVFIKRRATGSGNIEVHVLSAASGFQTFTQHTA